MTMLGNNPRRPAGRECPSSEIAGELANLIEEIELKEQDIADLEETHGINEIRKEVRALKKKKKQVEQAILEAHAGMSPGGGMGGLLGGAPPPPPDDVF